MELKLRAKNAIEKFRECKFACMEFPESPLTGKCRRDLYDFTNGCKSLIDYIMFGRNTHFHTHQLVQFIECGAIVYVNNLNTKVKYCVTNIFPPETNELNDKYHNLRLLAKSVVNRNTIANSVEILIDALEYFCAEYETMNYILNELDKSIDKSVAEIIQSLSPFKFDFKD